LQCRYFKTNIHVTHFETNVLVTKQLQYSVTNEAENSTIHLNKKDQRAEK